MANFSTTQVRQFYAASAYKATVEKTDAVGTIGAIKKIEDGLGDQIMFLFKGADTVLRSDLIQIKNIGYAKAIAAADMVTVMKKVKVALKSDVAEGAPVSGQDYILGINLKNFFSSGDAYQYYKSAVVHATSGMTATQFYAKMVDSLNQNFSREDGATKTSNPYLKFTSDANGVYLEELPQEWVLGIKKARRIMFDVTIGEIYTGGDDVTWGEATDVTPAKEDAVVGTNAVGNGQNIADLEWFCAGERGDQYRMMGWPNYIPTKYLVDPTKQYNALEIHYAFTDAGTGDYRTEKEITIVAEDATELNKFITAFNAAAGTSIATLATD